MSRRRSSTSGAHPYPGWQQSRLLTSVWWFQRPPTSQLESRALRRWAMCIPAISESKAVKPSRLRKGCHAITSTCPSDSLHSPTTWLFGIISEHIPTLPASRPPEEGPCQALRSRHRRLHRRQDGYDSADSPERRVSLRGARRDCPYQPAGGSEDGRCVDSAIAYGVRRRCSSAIANSRTPRRISRTSTAAKPSTRPSRASGERL